MSSQSPSSSSSSSERRRQREDEPNTPHHVMTQPVFLQKILPFAATKKISLIVFNSVSSSWSETIVHYSGAVLCWISVFHRVAEVWRDVAKDDEKHIMIERILLHILHDCLWSAESLWVFDSLFAAADILSSDGQLVSDSVLLQLKTAHWNDPLLVLACRNKTMRNSGRLKQFISKIISLFPVNEPPIDRTTLEEVCRVVPAETEVIQLIVDAMLERFKNETDELLSCFGRHHGCCDETALTRVCHDRTTPVAVMKIFFDVFEKIDEKINAKGETDAEDDEEEQLDTDDEWDSDEEKYVKWSLAHNQLDGTNVLIFSLRSGSPEVVKFIIEQHRKIGGEEFVKKQFRYDSHVDFHPLSWLLKTVVHNESPLIEAKNTIRWNEMISEENIQILMELILSFNDPKFLKINFKHTSRSGCCSDVLWHGCHYHSLDFVKPLVEAMCSSCGKAFALKQFGKTNIRTERFFELDRSHESPFFVACQFSSPEVVQYLMEVLLRLGGETALKKCFALKADDGTTPFRIAERFNKNVYLLLKETLKGNPNLCGFPIDD